MSEPATPWMLQELREQPEAIARLLKGELDRVRALAAAARVLDPALLYLAARGTSDHAAVYAKYLAGIKLGLPAALAAPSVVTLYSADLKLRPALVLGISQSGRAADAIEVMRRAREGGALTGCITNDPDSPMAATAEHPLYCHAGPEQSLPATKTYTTSLALVYALIGLMGGKDDIPGDLARVPDWISQVLATEHTIAERAERYRYMDECVVLGRGVNQCSVLEAALKLSETSYLRAQPFSAADFLHGPIAVIDEGYPCILIAPSGAAAGQMDDLVRELTSRGAELLIISDREDLLRSAVTPLWMPAVPELLSPLVAIVVAQLFAFHLARVKGRDPDRPRGLRKVTHTF